MPVNMKSFKTFGQIKSGHCGTKVNHFIMVTMKDFAGAES